jgi:hypothetical protein
MLAKTLSLTGKNMVVIGWQPRGGAADRSDRGS